MKKLTADVARRELRKLQAWEGEEVLTLKEEVYLQALEIALPILEQQERGEGEWIKCSERLPEETKDEDGGATGYLVLYEKGREPNGGYNVGVSNVVFLRRHWQPLPAPPECV